MHDNLKKVILFAIIAVCAYRLAGSYMNFEPTKAKKEVAPPPAAPLVFAKKEILGPLRELDRLALRALESEQWSGSSYSQNQLVYANFKPSELQELRQQATLATAALKDLKAVGSKIRNLKKPVELNGIYDADMDAYDNLMQRLRLVLNYEIEVSKLGSLPSKDKQKAFIDNWVRLRDEHAPLLEAQRSRRRALMQIYTGEYMRLQADTSIASIQYQVKEDMTAVLEGKSPPRHSLWEWRQGQEADLAEALTSEPSYLLEPLIEADLHYKQASVDFTKSFMRNQPKTKEALDKRAAVLEPLLEERKRRSRVLTLY